MSVLDGPMGQLAATLIDSVGLGSRPATLRRTAASDGGYNAGVAGGGAVTDYACRVAFAEYGQGQIDGTLIRAGDRKAIASRVTLTVEPDPARDTLIESGRTWQIVAVKGFSSGAQEAAYEMQVRR